MELRELYEKMLGHPAPKHLIGHEDRPMSQFSSPKEPQETIKDSIHLECRPLDQDCPECGVSVLLWDGFAHRTLWNQTWEDAVAFQPVSTRYEEPFQMVLHCTYL